MNYTYGYIKNAILTKMNLTEKEANEQGLLDTFIYNINECLTQIASTIKPHYNSLKLTAYKNEIPIPSELLGPIGYKESVAQKTERENKLAKYLEDKIVVGNTFRMPEGFIAFSGKSIVQLEIDGVQRKFIPSEGSTYCDPKEVHDEVTHVGNDKIIFLKPGKYTITYDAFWKYFGDKMLDTEEIDIPADIIMCIPSYVASQLWKIDDERKAAIFRNEFEILFARINNSDHRGNKTFTTEGGW